GRGTIPDRGVGRGKRRRLARGGHGIRRVAAGPAAAPRRAPVPRTAPGSARVAVTEYGGWLRVRQQRLIGNWSGHGQGTSFCPRQRGWLRIIGAEGKPVAQAELPREGLF